MNKWMLVPTLTAALTIGGVALAKDTPPTDQSVKANNLLSQEQVIAIAKAKVNGVVVEIELEKEKNQMIYEIELEDGTYEYELEIDAVTGKILKYSKEPNDKKVDKTPTKLLTSTEAITIAKTVGKGEVVKFKLDEDDDRDVYEVKMKDDQFKYEIVLDARTGEIIEFEKELLHKEVKPTPNNGKDEPKKTVPLTKLEPAKKVEKPVKVVIPSTVMTPAKEVKPAKPVIPAKPIEPAKPLKLTKEQVIAIAKGKVAGTVTDIELEGKVYELEIENGDDEYEVKINAFTGEILSIEKD